ncbi:MAG: F0F1 ATP synthase subunit B [Planctomycetes bacterium]|nr:F0F1 ATP synthase subunit B [Planctomycetota bacterium]
MIGSLVLLVASSSGGFDPLEFAPGASFWTLVIFLLALVPMWKFVFGPITKALDNRDRKLDEAIAAAEKARRGAEEQAEATRRELEQARREARDMVADATARAERQAKEALDRARADAQRQVEQARNEIESLKQRALEEIRREVVDLSIRSAGKLLQRDLDDDAHRRFVDEFLTTVDAGGGAR